jgi:hypothetical protein
MSPESSLAKSETNLVSVSMEGEVRAARPIELILAFLISFCAVIPFLGKAVHQDDWAYLRVAELIRDDPSTVLEQTTLYQGTIVTAGQGVLHGPVWMHTLAFALGFGESGELVARVIAALCLGLLAVAMASLAARFGAPPLQVALLVCLSSVPLTLAGTLMTDLPMLSFFCASLALAVRGIEGSQGRVDKGALLAAGLFAAAASLTRYHGLAVLPMLFTLPLIWPRARFAGALETKGESAGAKLKAQTRSAFRFGFLPFAIGTAIVVAYLASTFLASGVSDSTRAVDALADIPDIDRAACLLATFAALGGAVLGIFVSCLCAPNKALRALRGVDGLGKLLLGLGLGLGVALGVWAESRVGVTPVGVNLWLQRLLLVLGAAGLLSASRPLFRFLAALFPRSREVQTPDAVHRETWLFAWLIGFAFAAVFTVPFGSTRYVLPAIPALVLFVALIVSRRFGPRVGWLAILPTALIGVGSAVADLHAASVYPEFASKVAERRAASAPPNSIQAGRLFIWGELGFRWYLEEEPALRASGSRPTILARSSNEPVAGDHIFKSALCTASADGLSGTYLLNPALVQRMKNESVVSFEDPWPIRIHNPYVGAGFYGAAGGILPFAWASANTDQSLAPGATVPHDRIQTWEITGENPFFASLHRARIEPTTEKTVAGGNIQIESFRVAHGIELGIEQKTALSILYPGRVTWEGVPLSPQAEALELFVAEHDRTAFMPGPGALLRVLVNGEVLYEVTLDSRRNESDRRWFPVRVNLKRFAGQTVAITFEAMGGPWPDKPSESQGPPPISVGFAEPQIR